MKKLFVLMIVMAMFSCTRSEKDVRVIKETVSPAKEGIFIHITKDHNDPHRVLMPLQMALMMADDKDVLIYLDIDAVNLVTRDAEDLAYGHFTPLKESFTTLLEKGVTIYACPGCMKIAGIEEADLMDGIKVAEKEKFFSFTDGGIISLSY
jgi:predicted peroxiredoxin